MSAVLYETIDDSKIVIFNRPEIRNPLSVAVIEELSDFLTAMDSRIAGRIIFTGRNEVFASGADLREIAGVTAGTAPDFARRGQRLMSLISRFDTIAAVNGLCFGGAFDLALACRARIASPNAEFCHPGANLGIMTGWGGTQRLPRLIGRARALGIFLTARRVSADEALQIGLIDEVSVNPLETALKFRPSGFHRNS